MSQLPFEFLTSPVFDQLIRASTETIFNICTIGERVFNPQPLNAPVPIEPAEQPVAKDMNQQIQHLLVNPILFAGISQGAVVGGKAAPKQQTITFSEKQLFERPSLLTNRAAANKKQLEAWAAGLIYAHLLGHKAYLQSVKMVWPTDQLPLVDTHLQRCMRLVRLERKHRQIPPIDAQNGKVKQKSVSVMGKQSVKQQITKEKEQKYLADYRTILKNVLRDFNIEFEQKFGREPSKDDKEILRPLYMEYKALKQFVGDDVDPKGLTVEDPILKPLITQLVNTKQQATVLLQKVVPRDQQGIRLFKREVQKCLFSYKEVYDKCLAQVQAQKRQTGKLPNGLQDNWAQGFIEVYNLLFNAYDKLKASVK